MKTGFLDHSSEGIVRYLKLLFNGIHSIDYDVALF
jgi:hypothetical protein